jgi:tRNA(Ile)-lysidine synthase
MNPVDAIADFLHRHGLAHTTGIVAVSGGPDSVALAHFLAGLLREGKISRLLFAHLNHQLRGEESNADEDFVRHLPECWQMADSRLVCHTQRVDVAARAKTEKLNLESVARRERYRWLTQLAHAEGAAWVATGHTADDQAETVLFRLLRGSGVLGLGGMKSCRRLDGEIRLLRPMLALRRADLLDYLHAGAIPYRVDSSNRDPRFTRNRLRLQLLPLLEEQYSPAVVTVLGRLAEQAQQLHGEIAQLAMLLLAEFELPRAGNILVFSAERLKQTPPNLLREMFRTIWQREAWPMGEMDFDRWNRLVEVVQGIHTCWDFPGGIRARLIGAVLQLRGTPADN